jgi:phosphoribosyl-AMP cyclohydrolase
MSPLEQATDLLDFAKGGGLVPVVAQDWHSYEILMVAFLNQEAWRKSLELGEAVYYSRGKDRLWHKGESSGHVQRIKEIRVDCDEDAVVFLVEQVGGAACHTGYNSCFFRRLDLSGSEPLNIFKEGKVFDPNEVYADTHSKEQHGR